MIATQRREVDSYSTQITSLQEQIAAQQLLINELSREAYEKRSERYWESPAQLEKDFEHLPEAADAAQGLAEALDEVADVSATEVSATPESCVPAATRTRGRKCSRPATTTRSYLRNHWQALTRYLNDGRLPIENNETEHLMTQVAEHHTWSNLSHVDLPVPDTTPIEGTPLPPTCMCSARGATRRIQTDQL